MRKVSIFTLFVYGVLGSPLLEASIYFWQQDYSCEASDFLGGTLWNALRREPFNGVALGLFLGAIIHSFCANSIAQWAHRLKLTQGKTIFVRLLHVLGEVECVFGLWSIPLLLTMIFFYGKETFLHYLGSGVQFHEPIFVIVIMSIAGTKPILWLVERGITFLVRLSGNTVSAWWFILLAMGPLMGSFITEPAAMTICALLLCRQFYRLKPSGRLRYATLGLLFVNVSVGGALTHFAAPPILMVAKTWNLGLVNVFQLFGWRILIGVLVATFGYFILFRKELRGLQLAKEKEAGEKPMPWFIVLVHVFFLIWSVCHVHHIILLIGGFLFFLGFVKITKDYQSPILFRGPLLVGFFLAGLMIHGGAQQWWLSPVLGTIKKDLLFFGALFLTPFNDNAAITYLCSLVPDFLSNVELQRAVIAGALSGGGLTVIANAPNLAGQSILSTYFPEGVSPWHLFLGALFPTIVHSACLMLL